MRRRVFISVVGGILVRPLNALGQGQELPVIGFLNSASRTPFAQLVAAFHKGLNEQGYTNDWNVKVEESWAEGDENRLMPLARELVQRQVKVMPLPEGSGPQRRRDRRRHRSRCCSFQASIQSNLVSY
jgi:putative tryptophan/tyrosine transport system substrate-binding protein